MSQRWLVVLIVLACVRVASADEVAGARFSVPSGWSSTDQSGLRVLAPVSLPKGELMKAIVIGVQPITGTPAAKLDEMQGALDADAKVTSKVDTQTMQRGAAGTLYVRSYEAQSKEFGAHARVIAVIVSGKQCAVVMILMTAKSLEKYAAGMQTILTSLEVAGTSSSSPTPAPSKTSIPTGNTPDAYPGSSGFRPSGRGVPVPAARVVDGQPQGIWWYPQVRGGSTVALRVIYLADGTCALNPRPGGPLLFDLDGQRRLAGVGTCTVANGTLTRTIDKNVERNALTSGTDKEGPYMNLGAMRHRPLAPVDAKLLVGTWKSAGLAYTFRSDGTFESGYVSSTGGVAKTGQWAVDGYTLFVRPSGEDGWVSSIGSTSKDLVVIDSVIYSRP